MVGIKSVSFLARTDSEGLDHLEYTGFHSIDKARVNDQELYESDRALSLDLRDEVPLAPNPITDIVTILSVDFDSDVGDNSHRLAFDILNLLGKFKDSARVLNDLTTMVWRRAKGQVVEDAVFNEVASYLSVLFAIDFDEKDVVVLTSCCSLEECQEDQPISLDYDEAIDFVGMACEASSPGYSTFRIINALAEDPKQRDVLTALLTAVQRIAKGDYGDDCDQANAGGWIDMSPNIEAETRQINMEP